MYTELVWWTHGLLLVAVAAWIGKRLLFAQLGTECIVPKAEEMTPFAVVKQTENRIVIAAEIPFVNEGKQCGTIMDAFVHIRCPYEQYNISIWGKAAQKGQPRADDYFEAMLMQKNERIHLVLIFCITPRDGISLAEALKHLPETLSFDLIYQETGRNPIHYSKVSLLLPCRILRD